MVCNNPSISISSIKFKGKENEIHFNEDDIVLLVGANNVGKSRALKDLQEDIIGEQESTLLIDKVEYSSRSFTGEQVLDYFDRNIGKNSYGSYFVPVKSGYYFSQSELENITGNEKYFYKAFLTFLSTESRLDMTKPIRFGIEVNRGALNVVEKLEIHPEAKAAVNEALAEGFGKSIDLVTYFEDDYAISEYRIGSYEEIAEVLNSSKDQWRKKIDDMENLQSQGDGLRSTVAILASLMVSEHSLFLIDEPEAFLHPPQAKMIGRNIVNASKGKQCFIATHNIDFIKGVVEADSSRVKIIKISRSGNKSIFDLIENDIISTISDDINLKYTSILDGLFYRTLALCENESDCRFYAAMLENTDLTTYQNVLFCAVGGKDQLKKIIPLLRRLHIHFIAIADIDLINNRNNLKQLLDSIGESKYREIEDEHQAFLHTFEKESSRQVRTQQEIKNAVNNIFNSEYYLSPEAVEKIKEVLRNASSLSLLKRGGKSILPQGECVAQFEKINKCLNDNNIFIVECGEIERFVPDVGGHGNKWLRNVFEKHPDIENDAAYDEAKAFVKNAFCSNRVAVAVNTVG